MKGRERRDYPGQPSEGIGYFRLQERAEALRRRSETSLGFNAETLSLAQQRVASLNRTEASTETWRPVFSHRMHLEKQTCVYDLKKIKKNQLLLDLCFTLKNQHGRRPCDATKHFMLSSAQRFAECVEKKIHVKQDASW